MRSRTAAADLHEAGVQALVDALRAIDARAERPPGGVDLLAHLPGGRRLAIEVKAASSPTLERTLTLVRQERSDADLHVLVADRILPQARQALSDAGWGWLDRRGHLRLRSEEFSVDMPVQTTGRARQEDIRRPIAGRSGMSVALAALMNPSEDLKVRAIARRAGLSPAAISQAKRRLHDASLIDDRGRPLVPELFWSLTEVWDSSVVWIDVRLGKRALARGRELEHPGWAVSGTQAAIAWGAPIAESGASVIDVYVPDEASKHEAVRSARDRRHAVDAHLAIAPSSLIVAPRFAAGGSRWPVVHPVVAALDLSTDPSRGREVLEAWDAPEGFERVW